MKGQPSSFDRVVVERKEDEKDIGGRTLLKVDDEVGTASVV